MSFLEIRYIVSAVTAACVGGLVYWISSRRRARSTGVAVPEAQFAAQPSGEPLSPRRVRVSGLHVTVWAYDLVLERLSPDQAIEALDEIQALGESLIRSMGGHYERNSGSSFSGFWLSAAPTYSETSLAVQCGLSFRHQIRSWNELRKTDGHSPLTLVMGADWGVALQGQVGPDLYRNRQTFVGEVASRARSLSQLAVPLHTDFLVSDDLWTVVSEKFIGERVAEANLYLRGGLTSCYRITGFRDENGNEVTVAPAEPGQPGSGLATDIANAASGFHYPDVNRPADEPAIRGTIEENRWMVNNGSHIDGPFKPAEIAQRLHSQDLDFDCECWVEGKGNRTTIARSGMFGGPTGTELHEEVDARFWVFDGETVHGPLTEGFLRTAITRQAFSQSALWCESTTLNGWKPLAQFAAAPVYPTTSAVPGRPTEITLPREGSGETLVDPSVSLPELIERIDVEPSEEGAPPTSADDAA